MIPAGYLLKRLSLPPGWLSGPALVDVCSVADCVNENVVDVQTTWQHNGFGLANDPRSLWPMAALTEPDAAELTLFYYEAYEQEIESDGWLFERDGWRALTEISSGVETMVVRPSPPLTPKLIGFDVVVFGDFLEHSPLSCNSVAGEVDVNEHCLFRTLDKATGAIDAGMFGGGCEEGVYQIFSVSVITASLVMPPPIA